LLAVSDVALQRRLARKIIEKSLSVRDTERLVRRTIGGGEHESPGTKAARKKTTDPNMKAAETRLRRKLGTRVTIQENEGDPGGRIEIEYYSAQDLDRFYALLMAEPGIAEP
jgi:ParB family chromosome partitioning protein